MLLVLNQFADNEPVCVNTNNATHWRNAKEGGCIIYFTNYFTWVDEVTKEERHSGLIHVRESRTVIIDLLKQGVSQMQAPQPKP